MTAREFCYWLQGFFELRRVGPGTLTNLTEEQTETVQHHLNMVFAHDIDPAAGGPAHQAALDALHQGKPKPPGGTPRC